MKKTIIMSIVAAAGLAVSGLATAGAPSGGASVGNWYAGIGINYNAIQKDRYEFLNGSPPSYISYDILDIHDHDFGINVFVGNRVTNYFANELGVNLIGDTRWKNHEESTPDEYITLKIHGIYHVYYNGYFFIPLMHPSFEAFAKCGASYLEAKNSIKEYTSSGTDVFESVLRTFALNYGAGVQFNAEQFGIRGEYTRVVPNHDSDDFHALTDSINLDFIWFFR